jgi:hypothetical protein
MKSSNNNGQTKSSKEPREKRLKKRIKHDPGAESARAVFGKDQ